MKEILVQLKFTNRSFNSDINEINEHMKEHKKDFHSQRGLMKKLVPS